MICRDGELTPSIVLDQTVVNKAGANLAKRAPIASPTRDTRHRGRATNPLQLVDITLVNNVTWKNSCQNPSLLKDLQS